MFQTGVHLPKEQGPSHLFLARYYMKKSSFREAEAHAHKATEFVMVSHNPFLKQCDLCTSVCVRADEGGRKVTAA